MKALEAVACVVLLVGCSGSVASSAGDGGTNQAPPDGGSSGDSSKISTLSDADLGTFCGELAAIEGGYNMGTTLSCDGGTKTVTFNIGADEVACKTKFQTQLPVTCIDETVGDLKGCVTALYSANACGSSSILEVPACSSWVACASSDQ